jgi:hypothetical protein
LSGNLALGNNDITGVDELVFNDNVRLLDQGDDKYLNLKWNNSAGGGLILYDGDGVRHGTFYGSGTGETGILDNDGSWAVRIRTGSSSNIYYCNGNAELYVLTTYVYAPGSFRSPIFYDYNNTSYYLNPSTTGVSANFAGTVTINQVNYTGTDGTAGQVLTTDGSGNATFADAAGGGALELISSTTIGTAVSTVDITSGFSSSYDTYMIDVTGVAKNVARDANVELQIYDNGTLLTGANYDFKDESAANVNGANEFTIGEFDLASNDNGVNFTIRNANDATWYVESMGGRRIFMLGGWYDQSTGPVTGFRLLLSRDDMTGGTIRLYGVKNS